MWLEANEPGVHKSKSLLVRWERNFSNFQEKSLKWIIDMVLVIHFHNALGRGSTTSWSSLMHGWISNFTTWQVNRDSLRWEFGFKVYTNESAGGLEPFDVELDENECIKVMHTMDFGYGWLHLNNEPFGMILGYIWCDILWEVSPSHASIVTENSWGYFNLQTELQFNWFWFWRRFPYNSVAFVLGTYLYQARCILITVKSELQSNYVFK